MKLVLKRTRRGLVWLGLAVVYALPLLTLRGAMDMFLKIVEAPGESTDKSHINEIDILAWSWGMTNPGSFHNGGAGSSLKPAGQDITITKYIDKASPTLMYKLFTGQQMGSAILSVRRQSANPFDFLRITLEPVLVTSYTTGGAGTEAGITENISLNFGKMSVDYRETEPSGGPGDHFTTELDFGIGPK